MKTLFLLCGDIRCVGYGSQDVYDVFVELQEEWFDVRFTGCLGFCAVGPVLQVKPGDTFYQQVQPSDVREILEATWKGETVERLLYHDPTTNALCQTIADIPFYQKQHKIVLHSNGQVSPDSLDEYLTLGGYDRLKKSLTMKPREVIDLILQSGLRGRGSGFSTGQKWNSVFEAKTTPKYLICNGDEGDPGAFMARSVLQGTPHAVLEGMIIGAYAIGVHQGYIYVPDEYPLAIKYVQKGINGAKSRGFLGEDILNSGFRFDITMMGEADAFACGDSSVLLHSNEETIGESNEKERHDSEYGFRGKATILHTVETFANIPYIVLHGAEAFRKIGTAGSPGTKVFSLVGKVKNTGLIEVEMGTTLREVIYDIGGGILNDRPFKATHIGGPSGGCIPADYLETPIDFDSLTSLGAMIGSGGMIVMDDWDCMVEVARYFTRFLLEKSCGKCKSCREGLVRIDTILERIVTGEGKQDDGQTLYDTSNTIADNALCRIGKTGLNFLLSTLRYFQDEYCEHIENKRCPAGVCKALTRFEIDPERCTECGACFRACPARAIGVHGGYRIIREQCINCGECRAVCDFDAIRW